MIACKKTLLSTHSLLIFSHLLGSFLKKRALNYYYVTICIQRHLICAICHSGLLICIEKLARVFAFAKEQNIKLENYWIFNTAWSEMISRVSPYTYHLKHFPFPRIVRCKSSFQFSFLLLVACYEEKKIIFRELLQKR